MLKLPLIYIRIMYEMSSINLLFKINTIRKALCSDIRIQNQSALVFASSFRISCRLSMT